MKPVRVRRPDSASVAHVGSLVKHPDSTVTIFGIDPTTFSKLIKQDGGLEDVPAESYYTDRDAFASGWAVVA